MQGFDPHAEGSGIAMNEVGMVMEFDEKLARYFKFIEEKDKPWNCGLVFTSEEDVDDEVADAVPRSAPLPAIPAMPKAAAHGEAMDIECSNQGLCARYPKNTKAYEDMPTSTGCISDSFCDLVEDDGIVWESEESLSARVDGDDETDGSDGLQHPKDHTACGDMPTSTGCIRDSFCDAVEDDGLVWESEESSRVEEGKSVSYKQEDISEESISYTKTTFYINGTDERMSEYGVDQTVEQLPERLSEPVGGSHDLEEAAEVVTLFEKKVINQSSDSTPTVNSSLANDTTEFDDMWTDPLDPEVGADLMEEVCLKGLHELAASQVKAHKNKLCEHEGTCICIVSIAIIQWLTMSVHINLLA